MLHNKISKLRYLYKCIDDEFLSRFIFALQILSERKERIADKHI